MISAGQTFKTGKSRHPGDDGETLADDPATAAVRVDSCRPRCATEVQDGLQRVRR